MPKKRLEGSKKKEKNTEAMHNFFMEIWKKRPHYCQVTGESLGNEPLSYMFEHLLEKSKYPHLAFEEDNIILCTLNVHDAKTMGYPLPKHQEFIEKAKERFGV
jgi:hypothetical protein